MTQQRFGKVIRLFAPLYLSNECINNCQYCGFSRDNPILRVTLTLEEVRREARALQGTGLPQHPARGGRASEICLQRLSARLRRRAARGSARASRWKSGRWKRRITGRSSRRARTGWWFIRKPTTATFMRTCTPPGRSGISTGGWKRRSAPTPRVSGGSASARFTAWPTGGYEAISVAAHADYLLRNCWKAQLTISLPRLRPCAGEFQPLTHMTDRELAQLVCAFRLMFPDVGLVLSTREPAKLRDGLIPLGITLMSAGSHTEPGGYTGAGQEKLHHTERGRIVELASGASEWAAPREPDTNAARATSPHH